MAGSACAGGREFVLQMVVFVILSLVVGCDVGERKWIEEDEDGRRGTVTVLPCHGGVHVVVAMVMVTGDGGVEDGWEY